MTHQHVRLRRRAPAGRRAVLAAGLMGLLASCDGAPPVGDPSAPPAPDPDAPPPEVGRSAGSFTREDGLSSSVLREMSQGQALVFDDMAELEQWRLGVTQPSDDAQSGPEQEVLPPITFDEASEVVIVDVFDACDAAHRFVAGDPGIVLSEVYDPTPEEMRACETPLFTLVLSVVALEEIGATSAQEVTVR